VGEIENSEAVMVREIRADYDQIWMFPPSLEDWVGHDHPARFIRDFVDMADLEELGFRIPACEMGRPPYAADQLLKVWLYGYFNRITSSRKLERACREHMGLIWLTGMQAPDHNSLWRFFKANKKAMRAVFKQSIQVALKSDLIGLALHAVDGTKIRARSSNDKVRSKNELGLMLEKLVERLDRSIADVMTEIERCERTEAGEYRLPASLHDALKRKERIGRALKELQESGRNAVNPAEPEARFMKNRRTKDLCYNGQAMADEQSGMIVAAEVVTDGADNGQLVPMIDQAVENVGAAAAETVADAGYFASSQIGLAQERRYEVLASETSGETAGMRSVESDPYHHSRFTYDEERDCCICPHGNVLPFLQKKVYGSTHNEVRRYRCRDYEDCAHRWDCSQAKHGRMIDISVHFKALERHRAKRDMPEKRKQLKARKRIIEPVFGWIKEQLGFRRWTMSGLEGVRAQWALVCATINLKKLYRHWVSGKVVLSPC